MALSLNSVIAAMNDVMQSSQRSANPDVSGVEAASMVAAKKAASVETVTPTPAGQGKAQLIEQIKKKTPGVQDLIDPVTQMNLLQTQDLATQNYIMSAYKSAMLAG
jgi:hypothetical protein